MKKLLLSLLKGKVSILATGCASITKDFEVKQGAEFEVRTE